MSRTSTNRSTCFLLAILAIAGLLGCGNENEIPKALNGLGAGTYCWVKTNHGEFVFQLRPDVSPKAVGHFIGLASGINPSLDLKTGKEQHGYFYDGLLFHRVLYGNNIEGGDPLQTSQGGPGYNIMGKLNPEYAKRPFLVVMGSPSGAVGSTFMVMINPDDEQQGSYTPIGEVVRGMETVTTISKQPAYVEHRPYNDVVIKKLRIYQVAADGKTVAINQQHMPEGINLTNEVVPTTDTLTSLTDGLTSGTYALVTTNYGSFAIQLFTDKAPKTAGNFIGLAEGTKSWTEPKTKKEVTRPFYDGLTFHRIVSNTVIQGGDANGDGSGGPGFEFEDEFNRSLVFSHKHMVAMANHGPNTNGSQFFISLRPMTDWNWQYTIFGEVVRGAETIDRIASVPVYDKVPKMDERPLKPVVMEKVQILRVSQ